MKKKMIALLAGALMVLGASNAMAYFGSNELIRIVENTSTGDEVVTDLGNVSSLISQANSTGSVTVFGLGGSSDAFTTVGGTNFAAGKDSNLVVAYLAYNPATASKNVWLSGTMGATLTNVGAQYNNFKNGYSAVFELNGTGAGGYYYNQTGLSSATSNSGTNTNSFIYKFDTASPGTFAGLLSTADGDASLATLASASVQQGLYFWSNGSIDGQSINQLTGLTILTNADGSTTIQAQDTPIPAAAYLLGSGLMGLFGLRRKQRA